MQTTNLLAHVGDLSQPEQSQNYGLGMMDGPGMMGWWPMTGSGWLSGFFGLVIGGLIILILIAFFRWLWHQGAKTGEK